MCKRGIRVRRNITVLYNNAIITFFKKELSDCKLLKLGIEADQEF